MCVARQLPRKSSPMDPEVLFPGGCLVSGQFLLAGVVFLLWDHTAVDHQNGADKLIFRDSNISWTQNEFRTLGYQWSLFTLGLERIDMRLPQDPCSYCSASSIYKS